MIAKHETRKYLGLELAGAKNQKTAIAVLEYFPKGNKTFLLEIYDRMPSGDQALLDLIEELRPGIARMGVNVPLELPPCISCTKKSCLLPKGCQIESVKWMREISARAARNEDIRVHEFTPYTQRPVELWIRYEVLPKLPPSHRFEIDEALGGTKAPLTARMHFLKRHLRDIHLSEAWPKLTMAILAQQLGISKRIISRYRHLEEGMQAREEIVATLIEEHRIFIYERDVRKLSHSLAAFDAFMCSYTALLCDLEQCAEIPDDYPAEAGWVQYPSLESNMSDLWTTSEKR
jgi:Protein of unknown function (DUF429)